MCKPSYSSGLLPESVRMSITLMLNILSNIEVPNRKDILQIWGDGNWVHRLGNIIGHNET